MKTTVLSFIVLLALSFTSCKERGCTITSASNYDAVAEVNNNSCTYLVAFWDDDESVDSYDIYVALADTAGALLDYEGSVTKMYHEDSLPSCDDIVGACYVAREPGTYDWEAIDNKGNVLSGIVKFRETSCTLQEIRL